MGLFAKSNFGIRNFKEFFLKLSFFYLSFLFVTPAFSEDVRYSHDKALVSAFNSALVSLSKGEVDEAENQIFDLKQQALSLGYSELSEFSFRLLRSARAHTGSPAEKKQIVKMAESLSPYHPGVLLAISGFSELFTTFEQIKYLKNGLLSLKNYPFTSISILCRLFTAISLASVLSAFVVLVIILISSMSELVSRSSKLFSRKHKKIGGAVVVFVSIIMPGFLPLTVAMVIWAFLLVLAMPRFWWLAISISCFCFHLEFLLEPSVLLASFTESPSSRALESIANDGFIPRIVDYVDEEVGKNTYNPVWYLILGQIFQSRGDDVNALENYRKAKLNIEKEKSISYLIALNGAVHSLQTGEAEIAFNKLMELKAQGWKQFEILFNISLVSTILHKTEVYDSVFKEMQDRYSDKLEATLQSQGDMPTPILGKLPNNFFVELISFELGRIWKIARAFLSPLKLLEILLFLSLAAFGVYKGIAKNSLRYSRTFINQKLFVEIRRNKVWSYLPLGWAIREGRLLILYVYLNISILLIILMNAQPIKLFVESDRGVTVLSPLFVILFLFCFKPFKMEVRDA